MRPAPSAGTVAVIWVALSTVKEETEMLVPPDEVNVRVGEALPSYPTPEIVRDVVPTGTFVDDMSYTPGTLRTVPTTTAAPLLTPYIVTEADTVWSTRPASSAGTVAERDEELVTVTVETVMDVERLVVSVTAGVPPDAKLVPVTMITVPPAAIFTLDVAVTDGMGRSVHTTTDEPLLTP